MFMTLRRLAPLVVRAADENAAEAEASLLRLAFAQRRKERGPSKLARRMRRKQQLGMAGAF